MLGQELLFWLAGLLVLSVSPQVSSQPSHGQHHMPEPREGHGHHGKPLQFGSEVHNAEHTLKHLESVVSTKPKEQMTEEELEFHYFKLHDYDNNNKLDGVEIGKALTHFHDGDDAPAGGPGATRAYSDEEMAEVIDAALESDDLNDDGYVEYPEFMAAQARRLEVQESTAASQARPPGDTPELEHWQQQEEVGPPGQQMRNLQAPGYREEAPGYQQGQGAPGYRDGAPRPPGF